MNLRDWLQLFPYSVFNHEDNILLSVARNTYNRDCSLKANRHTKPDHETCCCDTINSILHNCWKYQRSSHAWGADWKHSMPSLQKAAELCITFVADQIQSADERSSLVSTNCAVNKQCACPGSYLTAVTSLIMIPAHLSSAQHPLPIVTVVILSSSYTSSSSSPPPPSSSLHCPAHKLPTCPNLQLM